MQSYLADSKLSLKAKGLLTVLIERRDANLPLFPMHSYISDHDRTISSALNELKRTGYVTNVVAKKGKKIKIVDIELFTCSQEAQ